MILRLFKFFEISKLIFDNVTFNIVQYLIATTHNNHIVSFVHHISVIPISNFINNDKLFNRLNLMNYVHQLKEFKYRSLILDINKFKTIIAYDDK